jgi:hypothetical protein
LLCSRRKRKRAPKARLKCGCAINEDGKECQLRGGC